MAPPIFVCAPGAGGGYSRHDLLDAIGDRHVYNFKGCGLGLLAGKREEKALERVVEQAAKAAAAGGGGRPLFLVGQSFGSRCSLHTLCRPEYLARLPPSFGGVICFGYPLVHDTQHREAKLAELPASARVLFLSGTKDAMMDLALMERSLASSPAAAGCTVVKITDADHSMGFSKGRGAEAQAAAAENSAAMLLLIQSSVRAFVAAAPPIAAPAAPAAGTKVRKRAAAAATSSAATSSAAASASASTGVELVEEGDAAHAIALPKGRSVLGRGESLGLHDKRVHRNHVAFDVVDGAVSVTQLGSNSVCVQHGSSGARSLVRNEPYELRSGDRVMMIGTEAPFVLRCATAATAAAADDDEDEEDEDEEPAKRQRNSSSATTARAPPTVQQQQPPPQGETLEVGPFSVGAFGLGTLQLGVEYPRPDCRPPRAAAITLIHASLNGGCSFFDCADSYCAGPGGSAEAARYTRIHLDAEHSLSYLRCSSLGESGRTTSRSCSVRL